TERDDALAAMEVDDEAGIQDAVYEEGVVKMKTDPKSAASMFRSVVFAEGEASPEQL
ncbi:hypothetical protein BVRB_041190, partial [Beta vulgaris subsp. vulgaris]